jgi:uncharacterized membrane protein
MAQTSRVRRKAREAEDAVQDAGPGDDDDAPQGGAVKQLRGVASEAAVSVLTPVAKKFATRAAKMAVERGPELLEDEILPRLQDMGGKLGELGGRFGGGDDDEDGGGRAGDGTGKGRRMPIQQSVDVAAPLQTVYDQFTQFEEFPKFMHRVERVEQRDPETVVFHEKMWGIRRMWEAEIVEQEPDERIVWKTTSGMNHVGVITFHELSERLTRVELNIDLDPDGVIEKIARGARFAKRAARADLKRFKAFVEMRDEETGAWRGAIEDGDVVDEQDYEDEEEEEQEEPQGREDEDDEDEEQEEPQASEDEDEDEDEEESRRASKRTKSNGGRQRSKPRAQSRSKPKSKASSSSGSSSGSRSSSGRKRTKAGSR